VDFDMDDFCYEKKPFFSVSKDERDTKEDIGKLMKKTSSVTSYTKMH